MTANEGGIIRFFGRGGAKILYGLSSKPSPSTLLADEELLVGWGYTLQHMKELSWNCPLACALCEIEKPCGDDVNFIDAMGNECTSWIGVDCYNDDALLELG